MKGLSTKHRDANRQVAGMHSFLSDGDSRYDVTSCLEFLPQLLLSDGVQPRIVLALCSFVSAYFVIATEI